MKSKEGYERKSQGRFLSVLGLFTMHTVKPTMLLGAVLVLIQGILFLRLGMKQDISSLPLHIWMNHIGVKYCFIGVLISSLGICGGRMYTNNNATYTINRLGVSKKKMFFSFLLNGVSVVLIIWGIQLAFLLLGSVYYIGIVNQVGITPQTILLSSYRSEFFHMILPIEDVSLWIRNLALLLFLATSVAHCGMKKLEGTNSMALSGSIFMICLNFNLESGLADFYMIPFLVVCTVGLMMGGLSNET